MMHLTSYVFYFLLMGCASTQSSSTSSASNYTENLAVLRPVFEESITQTIPISEVKKGSVEPMLTVNEPLNSVLNKIDSVYLSRKAIDGYTIQIYAGQKREDALSAKKTIDQALPELKAEMTYVQPTFRIKAGRYYTQLDAQKDYVAVKRYFPSAILVPDRFQIAQH